MGIILEIKNAIRTALYNEDKSINFNFNEIEVVKYPYLFLYFPNFSIDRGIGSEYWSNLSLSCVLEYCPKFNASASELWEYMETMSNALTDFEFLDSHQKALNMQFSLQDGVLQMTFDLNICIQAIIDDAELMAELDFSYKGDM